MITKRIPRHGSWSVLVRRRGAMRVNRLLGLGWVVAVMLIGSGCSSEEYYCDDSGCWYCDGVSCRRVDPPPRPDCMTDADCPTGSTCTSLGCTEGCASDADCPEGTTCRESMCVGPTEPDP